MVRALLQSRAGCLTLLPRAQPRLLCSLAEPKPHTNLGSTVSKRVIASIQEQQQSKGILTTNDTTHNQHVKQGHGAPAGRQHRRVPPARAGQDQSVQPPKGAPARVRGPAQARGLWRAVRWRVRRVRGAAAVVHHLYKDRQQHLHQAQCFRRACEWPTGKGVGKNVG
jgi:hypothetical protein